MIQTVRILAITFGLATLLMTTAQAETPYGALKLGVFLPNGTGNTSNTGDAGLKDFDSGFNAEAAIGFHLAPYAVVEFGAGYYRAERTDTVAANSRTYTLTTIPVLATVKYLITGDPLDFFIGAGAGYYYAMMDYDDTAAPLSKSTHGTALGYHLLGGADFHLNDRVSIGSEIKWNSANPKLDPDGIERKWDVGGTTISLTAKYRF